MLRAHRICTHIDSISDQVLKIYFSLTEQKRQHCGGNETKSHKKCLFLVLKSTEGEGEPRNRTFILCSAGVANLVGLSTTGCEKGNIHRGHYLSTGYSRLSVKYCWLYFLRKESSWRTLEPWRSFVNWRYVFTWIFLKLILQNRASKGIKKKLKTDLPNSDRYG